MPAEKRNRFRFSVRTLLLLVTVVAIFFAWLSANLKRLSERQDAMRWIVANGGIFFVNPPDELQGPDENALHRLGVFPKTQDRAPLSLRLLGEASVYYIFLPGNATEGDPPVDLRARDAKVPELCQLFPEAEIYAAPPQP
jgi:hypothetical protein